ncbi:MAG: hypothetical protein E7320_06560 [Clostridiales bacterium]|nr:hypothetical protein [Clostridiales bacterium]
MKKSLPIGVCILISLALVLFGLGFGTVKGFNADRTQVSELLSGENGLMDVLSYRGADGYNLCVVARRHLTDDADVSELSRIAAVLTDATQSLAAKKQENDRLDAAVLAVKTKLEGTATYQQSQRDQKYMAMLEGDLKNLSATDKVSLYNQAAQDFNSQLSAPVSGWIASLLGVKPCELYQ